MKLFLAQTDTTVGFLSKSQEKINIAKKRAKHQSCICCFASFKILITKKRMPKKHLKLIRRAKKISFILDKSFSFRVIKDEPHLSFIKKFDFLYSSSANISKQSFNETYARSIADEIIQNKQGFVERPPSKIIKLGKNKIKKIR